MAGRAGTAAPPRMAASKKAARAVHHSSPHITTNLLSPTFCSASPGPGLLGWAVEFGPLHNI